MADSARHTRFGRIHVAEPLSSIFRAHRYDGTTPLRAVAHPPTIPVLDQEDLVAQGINTAKLVPGARELDALGSCVANATVAALSTIMSPAASALAAALPGAQITGSAVQDEKTAILLYHALTMQTCETDTEWPPSDCGSSGVWACKWLEGQRVTGGHLIATTADDIVSLMQGHALITGQPFLDAWMTPDSDGFIDGDGTAGSLRAALADGVAGGHETCWYGIESLALDADGHVDPHHTVIRFRNSWGSSWGLAGSALAHLSTFIYLAKWCDHRALLPVSGGAS